jgi:hypothetical protein
MSRSNVVRYLDRLDAHGHIIREPGKGAIGCRVRHPSLKRDAQPSRCVVALPLRRSTRLADPASPRARDGTPDFQVPFLNPHPSLRQRGKGEKRRSFSVSLSMKCGGGQEVGMLKLIANGSG